MFLFIEVHKIALRYQLLDANGIDQPPGMSSALTSSLIQPPVTRIIRRSLLIFLPQGPRLPPSSCKTSGKDKREVMNYMTYYNHEKGQWNLKKMNPALYRNHLLSAA
ncbi:IS3 family transposase [Salibacterium aidingense]|uniref:IS3 family transposase n=1 Tax=Salibacterium aidingense TaxID=384933 RepID=UPI0012EBD43D